MHFLSKLGLAPFVISVLLCASAAVHGARSQTAQPASGFNPAAEQWIRQQVTKEQEADVASRFGAENMIRSSFLVELLRNPPKGTYGSQTSIRIKNVTVTGDLYLIYLDIPYELELRNCLFLGNVRFALTNFQRELSLQSSIFEGEVNCYGMKVAGGFNLAECHFRKKAAEAERTVNFEYMQIGRDLSIENARFEESVSFLRTRVSQIFAADDVKFLSTKGVVTFEDIRVEGDFLIRKSQIESRVNFFLASTGFFNAGGAHFNSAANLPDLFDAYFGGEKINGDATFAGAHFKGSVSFRLADVTKDFNASDAEFENENVDVDFFGMHVGRNAFFEKARFAGGARLLRMEIGGNLEFINVKAKNSNRLKDFRSLKADELIFDGAENVSSPYDLRGMSYRLIFSRVFEGDQPVKDVLLDFVDKSRYVSSNPDNYTSLKAFYEKQGNLDGAKAAHVAWQKRERAHLGLFRNPGAYFWNLVQFATTGYGQHLEWALVWSLGFIVAGIIVFWREKWMETKNKDDAARFKNRYHPVWYSIALFLPVVSLQDKDIWIPKPDRRKTRLYMRLHIIAGYLLIPVGLAAWTGLIK